eukprot:TRINITY_DN4229_c1_g1_i24.p1 TRINITY_DN4229_c1_g1~~TRINITY_DN4229_c1_g1_i24.p1  ORF type:complete len:112 (+),score=7.77 TRINITY_DN4229_c1_g1_i24:100-435(+)
MGQAVRIDPSNAQNWLSLAFAQVHYGLGNSSRHLYNGVAKFMPSSLSPNPSPDMFDFSESVAPVARLYVSMGSWKSPSRKARMVCNLPRRPALSLSLCPCVPPSSERRFFR